MDRLDEHPSLALLTIIPPTLPDLTARLDNLEARLQVTLTELRVLGADASWMARDAEHALELALQLLADEWSDPASGTDRPVA